MRILHVDSERPWRGGQNQILLLMRHQRANGHEPHLAAPPGAALTQRASGDGFRVHLVPMRGTWDVASVFQLASITRALRPEIVHWHAARAHALGAMAAGLAPGPARVLSRRVIYAVRGSLGSRLLYAQPVDRIIAISEAVREALVRSGVGRDRIDVVPSGIEPIPAMDSATRVSLRSSLGVSGEDVVAITVAALAHGKGHRDLFQALAGVPGMKLWVAGDGPLSGELNAERERLRLSDRVQFLGFRADIPSLLQAADLFALATRSEGLGSSVLEAMAAGLPVIATRVGGVPEIVEDGESGILVGLDHPDELSSALARIGEDRGMRERMGRRGLERAALFSAGRTAEGTERAYRSALDGRR